MAGTLDGKKKNAAVPRRFRRFQADLPVAVKTYPAPPHWVSLCLPGQTVNVSRGGVCVRFAFPVERQLDASMAVRLEIGPSDPRPRYTVRAKVTWVRDDLAGFEFTKILRPSEIPPQLRQLRAPYPLTYT